MREKKSGLRTKMKSFHSGYSDQEVRIKVNHSKVFSSGQFLCDRFFCKKLYNYIQVNQDVSDFHSSYVWLETDLFSFQKLNFN